MNEDYIKITTQIEDPSDPENFFEVGCEIFPGVSSYYLWLFDTSRPNASLPEIRLEIEPGYYHLTDQHIVTKLPTLSEAALTTVETVAEWLDVTVNDLAELQEWLEADLRTKLYAYLHVPAPEFQATQTLSVGHLEWKSAA